MFPLSELQIWTNRQLQLLTDGSYWQSILQSYYQEKSLHSPIISSWGERIKSDRDGFRGKWNGKAAASKSMSSLDSGLLFRAQTTNQRMIVLNGMRLGESWSAVPISKGLLAPRNRIETMLDGILCNLAAVSALLAFYRVVHKFWSGETLDK